MKVHRLSLVPLLLTVSAAAQSNSPAQIRDVGFSRSGNNIQLNVLLSARAQAKVIVAENPPRLVLELANTTTSAKQRRIEVGQDGIKTLRVGLTSGNPPVSRVVLDLESARAYELSTTTNEVTLTLLPNEAGNVSHGGSGAPSAAGVPLFSRWHRTKHSAVSASNRTAPAPVVPPAPAAPLSFPHSSSPSDVSTASVAAKPTAKHPNVGSLQQGTVFPALGQPGTGNAPAPTQPGTTTNTMQAQPASWQSSDPGSPIVNAPGAQPPSSPALQQQLRQDGRIDPPAQVASSQIAQQSPANDIRTVVADPKSSPGGSKSVLTPTVVVKAEPAPAAGNTDTNVPVLATRQPNADFRTAFRVKYVADGAAYLDAGRSSGLAEGMKLEVRDIQSAGTGESAETGLQVVAELKVISVAETSAVTDIAEPKRDIKPGDLAYLSSEDTQSLVAQRSLSPTRKYPAVISFTEGDPLEEEAREEVPRPPLPEINRARGRVGLDYSSIMSHSPLNSTSSNFGMVIRTDITRIGGSYWNMSGYWRARFTSNASPGQPTLQELLNRTYHLGLTYDNPNSRWVAGGGRLYLPWATSLDTIDGGYIGRRVGSNATVGLFAGSTPDPTSWSYAPDQQISGTFVNFEGGSFDNVRYTSTSGAGIQMLKWKINRPFVFFENGVFYKRYFSIYSAVQADKPASNPAVTSPGAGVSRSFTTLRIQPIDRLEFDINHSYFRDVPQFDPQLIGTGLLDKYLFQGFSAGPRVEVYKQIWVYATLGRSSRSGEAKSSLNQLYGVTFGELPWRLRADVRYSRFNSSFGDGDYKAFSISRNFRDNFRWELLAGQQAYASAFASNNKSHFLNANIDAPLGPHYFLQGGWTWNRGGIMNYDQVFMTFGYRFDSWHRGAK
jgi:AMIN domain